MSATSNQSQEIRCIRRAYIDVTGVIPTVEEMEWFVVYNNNGYEMAIDHLFRKYDTKLIKEYMLSEAYKQHAPIEIPTVQLKRSLLYIVGMLNTSTVTDQLFEQGKARLIQQAFMCSDSVDDVIDYMCNALMSRCSNVAENNMLSRKHRDAVAVSMDEHVAWMYVVNEILKLPDVGTK